MSGPPRKPDPRRRAADMLLQVKYGSTLPDIPFDCKFLPCPLVSLDRLIPYRSTDLERNHKWEVLCEADVGVGIDLIDTATYEVSNGEVSLNPTDAYLLEDDAAVNPDRRRSQQHNKVVPWMRKTEYIAAEFNRLGTSAERHETKIGPTSRKKIDAVVGDRRPGGLVDTPDLNAYKDAASQIEVIKASFESAKQPLTAHPTKKGVTAVEELPVLPHFDLWGNSLSMVMFDSDPASTVESPRREQLIHHSFIKGFKDSEQDYVGYFVPTAETLEARVAEHSEGKPYTEDKEYEFRAARFYHWHVKNRLTRGYKQDRYFVELRDGVCYFNQIDTVVRLSKIRGANAPQRRRFLITFREANDAEFEFSDRRISGLLRPYEAEPEPEPAKGREDDGSDKEKEEGGSPKNEKSHESSSGSGSSSSNSSGEDEEEEEGDEEDDK